MIWHDGAHCADGSLITNYNVSHTQTQTSSLTPPPSCACDFVSFWPRVFYVIISLVVNLVFIVVPFFALVVLNRAAMARIRLCSNNACVKVCSVLRYLFFRVWVWARGGGGGWGGSSFVPVTFVTVCANLS